MRCVNICQFLPYQIFYLSYQVQYQQRTNRQKAMGSHSLDVRMIFSPRTEYKKHSKVSLLRFQKFWIYLRSKQALNSFLIFCPKISNLINKLVCPWILICSTFLSFSSIFLLMHFITYYNYKAQTIPIVVVNSVDLARYFPWSIGIRYIGFSKMKTFVVLPTASHAIISKVDFGITNLYYDCLSMISDHWKDPCQIEEF